MGNNDDFALPELGSHALGTGTLPVEHYVSPEFLELEKKHIFRKNWLLVGRDADMKAAGDYLSYAIDALSVSVIVVRGKDQKIRAFYNACTHRGARLIAPPCGKARALVCGFHGWAFDFEGSLTNVPDEHLFCDLDRSKANLRPVSVDVWGGFVFINLDPKPQWTLREYLAPLGEAFDRYLGNPAWNWTFGWKARFNANWKLLVDAQIEGYHVDMTHRKTIAGAIPSASAPAYIFPGSVGVPCGVAAYRPADTNSGKQTEVTLLSAKYGATSIYTKSEKEFVSEGGEGVLKDSHPLWIFDNFLVFPNIVMFVQKGQILLQRTTPINEHECLWEVDFFHTEGAANFGHLFNFEQGRIQIRDVLSEDLYTAEGIHANFRGGAIDKIHANMQEVPIRAFYNRLMEMIEAGQKADAAKEGK